eukprot:2774213-Prymnesium_polylepis.1
MDALSTVHASTKCSARTPQVGRRRPSQAVSDGSLNSVAHAGTRALAQCAYARGYILTFWGARYRSGTQRLRVVRVNATVARLIHSAVRLWRSLAQL